MILLIAKDISEDVTIGELKEKLAVVEGRLQPALYQNSGNLINERCICYLTLVVPKSMSSVPSAEIPEDLLIIRFAGKELVDSVPIGEYTILGYSLQEEVTKACACDSATYLHPCHSNCF
jgi:hypothetical protein